MATVLHFGQASWASGMSVLPTKEVGSRANPHQVLEMSNEIKKHIPQQQNCLWEQWPWLSQENCERMPATSFVLGVVSYVWSFGGHHGNQNKAWTCLLVPPVGSMCLPIVTVGEMNVWHVNTVVTSKRRPMLDIIFISDLSRTQLLLLFHTYLERHSKDWRRATSTRGWCQRKKNVSLVPLPASCAMVYTYNLHGGSRTHWPSKKLNNPVYLSLRLDFVLRGVVRP